MKVLKQVSLGAGAYRDADGRPWILPPFAKAAERMTVPGAYNHEYTPFPGCDRLLSHARSMVFDDPDIPVASVQTIGGTGAVDVGAAFLSSFSDRPRTVLIPSHTWDNHQGAMQNVGFDVATYRYWAPTSKGLDFEGMCDDLQRAPDGSIVVLHACGHNPTGCDPTEDQWRALRSIFEARGHFAFFDDAYQGFASGDLRQDAM